MLQLMFKGKENKITADHLSAGEICEVVGYGNSMTPILKSGQAVICVPITNETKISRGDIVFCKVRGHYYLHLVHAVNNGSYLIGNNHGHMNGRISRRNIFGVVTKIL